jgi:hypothetical protein
VPCTTWCDVTVVLCCDVTVDTTLNVPCTTWCDVTVVLCCDVTVDTTLNVPCTAWCDVTVDTVAACRRHRPKLKSTNRRQSARSWYSHGWPCGQEVKFVTVGVTVWGPHGVGYERVWMCPFGVLYRPYAHLLPALLLLRKLNWSLSNSEVSSAQTLQCTRDVHGVFLQRSILPVLTEVDIASSYRGLYCQFLQRSILSVRKNFQWHAHCTFFCQNKISRLLCSLWLFYAIISRILYVLWLKLAPHFDTNPSTSWRFYRQINHENQDCARTHTNEQGRFNQKRIVHCPQLAALWEQDLHLVQRTPMSHHTMKARLTAMERAHWVFWKETRYRGIYCLLKHNYRQ